MYFQQKIGGWGDWEKISQSRSAFAPLVQAVCEKEGLPFEPFLKCTPSTNAVFEAGGQVIKIFAPPESGLDTLQDYQSECFGLERAKRLCLRAPKPLAAGEVMDRYLFRYLIMEKLAGEGFAQARKRMDSRQKQQAGRQLRCITEHLNTPCAPWGKPVDIKKRALEEERWALFPESFNRERRAFVQALSLKGPVYVHGDLNENNLLVQKDGALCVIDFADGAIAPAYYEHAAIACGLFSFERAFLTGYFGDYLPGELAKLCLNGLLLHDFGGDILQARLGGTDKPESLAGLYGWLEHRLSEN